MSNQPRYTKWGDSTYEMPPIGVVEGAGKPEGFKSVMDEATSTIHHSGTTSFGSQALESNMIVFTVQPAPSPDATRANHPDWYTMCIITPEIKRKILSTPGYPKPLNRPPQPRHRIAKSPVSGFGMFATADLELGDLVFSERAHLIMSPAIYQPANLPAHYTKAQIIQAALYEQEKTIEFGIGKLPKDMQEEYRALHNCHLHDGSGPLLGVLRTNSLCIEPGYHDDLRECSFDIPERFRTDV
ncbi:hypothetical protein AAF712_010103 [Marasmius tenuissimus]|uniref:Uncharacterized protein n=1 Tax=Marasmius tenuissimus TaxID=585030 RepID=A0ABR2ZMT2_9AGAR